ncbi:hypothetical protein HDU96_005085, partial [Phlyctochytrium bullatum]
NSKTSPLQTSPLMSGGTPSHHDPPGPPMFSDGPPGLQPNMAYPRQDITPSSGGHGPNTADYPFPVNVQNAAPQYYPAPLMPPHQYHGVGGQPGFAQARALGHRPPPPPPPGLAPATMPQYFPSLGYHSISPGVGHGRIPGYGYPIGYFGFASPVNEFSSPQPLAHGSSYHPHGTYMVSSQPAMAEQPLINPHQ